MSQTQPYAGAAATANAYNVDFGASLSPGAKIAAYVRSAGEKAGDYSGLTANLYTTLNEGLRQARASRNDVVVVLPGHTEDIASADQMSALKAGTRVVGVGVGTNRPTFTWTTAGSTWLLDKIGCSIENCNLTFATSDNSGVTVTAPVTISAAGCSLIGNTIRFGDDANDDVTVGITTTASADDMLIVGNHCSAVTTAECTTFMDIIGCDRLRMYGNYFAGATSNVAVGIVRFATTASLNIDLRDNFYSNLKALSTCAVTGLAAVSGVSMNEHFHYLDTASLTAWLTSPGIMTFHRPTVSNTAGETGSEVVGTVSA